jgi:hypothetical protein
MIYSATSPIQCEPVHSPSHLFSAQMHSPAIVPLQMVANTGVGDEGANAYARAPAHFPASVYRNGRVINRVRHFGTRRSFRMKQATCCLFYLLQNLVCTET